MKNKIKNEKIVVHAITTQFYNNTQIIKAINYIMFVA